MQSPKTYEGHICSFYLDTVGTIKRKCFMKKCNFNTWNMDILEVTTLTCNCLPFSISVLLNFLKFVFFMIMPLFVFFAKISRT